MKKIIYLGKILTMVFFTLNTQAQEKIVYSSKVLETTFEISENAKAKTFDVDGEKVEMFLFVSESKEFEYTLTVTKSKDTNVDFQDFKEQEYKNSYLQSCSCTIEEEKEQLYGDLKTYQFTTITKSKDQTFYGLVDNIEMNGNVFAFVYLTTLANYEKFKDSYQRAIESIKFVDIIN